ncbi:MAG TPA: type II toxin-antitoxin system RelE/ParE family toxin [Humisphaera sp.]|jgi:plasmid stabilization system protein ParE|nr:type II toxin-antitoxin system RelE/ParE family toxin [Humisphaera sp.]
MLDRYRIIILPRASADIAEAHAYIERDSPQNATAVVRRLIQTIDSLELLPHRFKVYRASRNAARVVRSVPVPPHILYYRVVERDKVVLILTIRHGARRQPRSFD